MKTENFLNNQQINLEALNSENLNNTVIAKFRSWSKIANLMVIVVGTIALLGWFLNIRVLTSVLPGLPTMKVNTALCFILSGISLGLWHLQNQRQQWSLRVRKVMTQVAFLMAFSVLLLGFLTVLEYSFHWSLGVDELFWKDSYSTTLPGRMGLNTAIAFSFVGASLIFLHKKVDRFAQILSILTLLIALMGLLGYIYGLSSLYAVATKAKITGMAVHTAINFILITTAIFTAAPDKGLMKIFSAKGIGGESVRRLFLYVLIVPLLVSGLVLQGYKLERYNYDEALAILGILNFIIFGSAVLVNGQSLSQMNWKRQEAMSALAESQKRLQLAIEGSEAGLWDWNVVTGTVYFSPEWLQMIDYNPGELAGNVDTWISLVHPDDLTEIMPIVQAHLAGETTFYEAEFRMRKKGGEWCWILDRGKVVERDQDGKALRMTGTHQDITARKEAEFALKEQQLRFEAIFNSMFQFMGLMATDGTLIEANQASLLFGGVTADQVKGQKFWDGPWWRDSIANQERLKEAIARANQGEFVRYEVQVLGPQKQVVTVDFSIKPIINEAGEVIMLIPEGRDISDRKQTEEELRISEERLQLALSGSELSLWDWNLVTEEMYLSDSWFQMLGFTRSELDVSPKIWQDLTHPNDLTRVVTALNNHLADSRNSYKLEHRIRTKSGDWKWIAIEGKVVERNAQGEPLRMVGINKDITEIKNTQIQLIQAEKMSGLGQVVAGIAHEINNPVSFIFGNSEYAREYTQNLFNLIEMYQKNYPNPVPEISRELEILELDFIREDFDKLLDSMKTGSTRIRDIVRSLRTFSRLDEADMKEVDLQEGIESALLILDSRLSGRTGEAVIEVFKEYAALPLVECYAGEINQVWMNILLNAIDVLQKQSEPRWIKIKTAIIQENDLPLVRVSIRDNGPGIPEDIKKRIFDPFFTTKPIGSGTGMGLAIAHSIIIDKHKGQLTCTSEPGQGTEFTITLPLRQG